MTNSAVSHRFEHSEPRLLVPDWPAPSTVGAFITTRELGPSAPPFDAFNLATHVGDDPDSVAACRQLLSRWIEDSRPLLWLEQTHGCAVATRPPAAGAAPPRADAAVALDRGHACVVMTADCLPVLFCDRAGTRVGVAHAGWRGLASGVLEATVAALDCPPGELLAWFGPAISNAQYEVGREVFDAFVGEDPEAEVAFEVSPYRLEHYMADLYRLARLRLERLGLDSIGGGHFCTASDPRFYSWRRDGGHTGRIASVVWLKA